ncbi:MAG TPA: hypothetical protein VLE70_17855 [Anaerolineae bacterium]|jgi:hypothetical protein|nr:hypothetical protein [Anaerolineae bacterium]
MKRNRASLAVEELLLGCEERPVSAWGQDRAGGLFREYPIFCVNP